MNNYQININFNDFTCWYNELPEFFKTVNWFNFEENDIVYYESASQFAEYDFKVIEIDHDKKVVEVKAVRA